MAFKFVRRNLMEVVSLPVVVIPAARSESTKPVALKSMPRCFQIYVVIFRICLCLSVDCNPVVKVWFYLWRTQYQKQSIVSLRGVITERGCRRGLRVQKMSYSLIWVYMGVCPLGNLTSCTHNVSNLHFSNTSVIKRERNKKKKEEKIFQISFS